MSGDRDDEEDDPFLAEDITELPVGADAKAAIARMAADGKIISVRTSKGRTILRLRGDADQTLFEGENEARYWKELGHSGRLKVVVSEAYLHAMSIATPQGAAEPPRMAEFCLGLLLSKAKGDALIGDLSERFSLDCERFGAARARRLYWSRTLKSLWPLLRRVIARGVKLGVVVETVRKFF